MKQLLQYLKNGKTEVVEVPCPVVRPGTVLVKTAYSLVSAGTERMVVEFAEKNLVDKARSRPDLVRQMIDKARREGIIPTVEAAFNRLDQPMALGYSSAGLVEQVGEGINGFQSGDRVACAGGGYAVHAEYAVVPKNLLVHLPQGVGFESGAFTTVGAVALHGFRLAQAQVGERVGVIGLGLLGLLAGQIALAAGCHVIGIDINPARVKLGNQLGIKSVLREFAEEVCGGWSSGKGCDVILICADTKSNDPVELAGALARDRGRVIAVGAVGNDLPRKIYYEKELSFQVSRSYGPGRYDNQYEEMGVDYPYGYVRWTEGRNLESFVDLLSQKRVDVTPLISHTFPIEQGEEAYAVITGKTGEDYLGVLLQYPQEKSKITYRVDLPITTQKQIREGTIGIGVIGAGIYANGVFLPAIKKTGGVSLVGIASSSGLTARHCAQKFGFKYATSTSEDLFLDPAIQVEVILTRHSSHSNLTRQALEAGKAVYCEKPLAINRVQLNELEQYLASKELPVLMVGFNRRFAPLAVRLKSLLSSNLKPFVIHYRVNAGYLPLNHWLHNAASGGGRIIGEACHFIDFLSYITGEIPIEVNSLALPDMGKYAQDNVVMSFKYADGSIGIVSYLANGDKRFPKERVEIFGGGAVGVLDDFRRLEFYRDGKPQIKQVMSQQDKGHRGSWQAFLACIRTGGMPPIPYDAIFGVTEASFAAVESLQQSKPVSIDRRSQPGRAA